MVSTNSITKWIKVSKSNPCSICGKPDWCRVLLDGTPVCSRVQSDIRFDNGGWVHNLKGYTPTIPQVKSVNQSKIASPIALNRAYAALLSNLPLSEMDNSNLQKRGLSQDQIGGLHFGTLPLTDRWSVIHKLESSGICLDGIPGFWRDDAGHRRLAGQPGILIPVRDIQGQIAGIQIRCNDTSTGKYKWLSSANKPGGCGSNSPIHVSMPVNPDQSKVWITEGPLKADIIRLKINRVVLAVPGVSTWAKAIPIVCKLKSKSAVVCFDMDKLTNPAVEMYKSMLIKQLLALNIRVFEADWDPNFKGLDDVLNNGELKWK